MYVQARQLLFFNYNTNLVKRDDLECKLYVFTHVYILSTRRKCIKLLKQKALWLAAVDSY